jgi:hypothetical protein
MTKNTINISRVEVEIGKPDGDGQDTITLYTDVPRFGGTVNDVLSLKVTLPYGKGADYARLYFSDEVTVIKYVTDDGALTGPTTTVAELMDRVWSEHKVWLYVHPYDARVYPYQSPPLPLPRDMTIGHYLNNYIKPLLPKNAYASLRDYTGMTQSPQTLMRKIT